MNREKERQTDNQIDRMRNRKIEKKQKNDRLQKIDKQRDKQIDRYKVLDYKSLEIQVDRQKER